MSKLLLAIDIGTSGCKMTFFDIEGVAVASETAPYHTYYPRAHYVEQNPDEWWTTVCKSIKRLVKNNNIDVNEIVGIGVDGHSWACLPIDEEGRPLRNAMIWLDRRAEKQAQWMKDKVGEYNLIKLSGNPVDAAYITPKILWMKEHEPKLYNKTYKFLQSNAYMAFKLTGKISQDYSQAYGFHFFNIKEGKWDEQVANDLGINLEHMAPLMHCHDIVGTVTQKAAEEMGLKDGIPVVAGGLDAACCTLGAGVIHTGQTQEQGGQAGGMSILLEEALIHPKLILGYHVIPDKWLLQGGTVGGGGTLNWFNRELGTYEQLEGKERGISSFEVMSEEAEKIPVGSEGLTFLPYMAGERSPIWDSYAKGVYFGLSFDKTRAHMIRSMMEGVGYSLYHNLETAEEVNAKVEKLISVGGSANSKVWTQIKADITGKPIDVPFSDHATALGAAILAGVGTGIYKSFEEAVNRTVHIQKQYIPDENKHTTYKNHYPIYLEIYKQLKDTFRKVDML